MIFADRTEGGRRLAAATRWLHTEPGTEGLAIGYFGVSTGAATCEPNKGPERLSRPRPGGRIRTGSGEPSASGPATPLGS